MVPAISSPPGSHTTSSRMRRAAVPPGADGRALGAVPDGRTHAALRSERPRRARRACRRATAAGTSCARSWKASRSACATRSRSSPRWACRSGASASAAAERDRHSGDRSRPTSIGTRRSTPSAADEGAAYGAAILAAVGIERWPTVDAACDRSGPRRRDDDAPARRRRADARAVPAIQTAVSRIATCESELLSASHEVQISHD